MATLSLITAANSDVQGQLNGGWRRCSPSSAVHGWRNRLHRGKKVSAVPLTETEEGIPDHRCCCYWVIRTEVPSASRVGDDLANGIQFVSFDTSLLHSPFSSPLTLTSDPWAAARMIACGHAPTKRPPPAQCVNIKTSFFGRANPLE